MTVVDPTNPNYAISADGSPLFALRICKPKDPAAITDEEIAAGQIVGYTPWPIVGYTLGADGSSKLTEES